MSTDRLAGDATPAPEEADANQTEPANAGSRAPGDPGSPATAGTAPDDHSAPSLTGADGTDAEATAAAGPAGQGGADEAGAPGAGASSRSAQDTGGEQPPAGEADGPATGEQASPPGQGTPGPGAGRGSGDAESPGPDEAGDGAGAGAPTPAGQDEPGDAGASPHTEGGTPEQAPAGHGASGPAASQGDSGASRDAGAGAGDGASAPAGQGASGGGGKGRRSAAAEALAAAVRAVESGERSAASFFNDAPAARPAAQATPAAPAAPAAPRERARAAAPGSAHTSAPAPVRPPSARPARGPGGEVPGSGDVREVLAAGGAPEALAGKVAETLGEHAAEVLREDPWQLLAVPGVRPDQADGFARSLLGPACEPGDERRALALTGWLLERAALEGHTALESSALREALAKASVPDPDEALRTAIAEGAVLVFQDALDAPAGARPRAAEDEDAEQPVRVLLGLDRYALAEESLADGLARLASTFAPAQDGEASAGGAEWERAAAAAPSASAAELIRTVAAHGLIAHSGGEAARAEPAALVAAARAMGLRAYAAAHTEDGRRRLAAALSEAPGTGPEADPAAGPDAAPEAASAAVTVAGLLADAEGPGRDEEGALALDLLAVLDAPQLDVETAAMLVESLPDGARLVLSGDPGVLWSAGPGRVFADLVAARRCPQVVSRTPDPGPIGELVSGIGIGELSQVEAPGKEVVIVPVRDAGEAVHRTVQLVADSVPRAIGVPPEQTQVITPGHGGAAGTRALNAALKNRLNPGPGRFGGFDPGDRVAYTPAPGRTVPGTVVSADAEGLRLDCAGTPVVVAREEVAELVRHGWALTAHQAAGARWPAAVVVLPRDATAGLTRAWVYTAFGRGERHLSVVHGAEAALPRAVAETPFKDRTTRLRALLQAQVPPAPTG
ncbi:helix-hairpin-helix domain-containing protein [Streptomyces violaceusniger]|uniref:ATP-dependent RecD2 DNA helicase-like helix-hairpin-helix domain-containing protein n=1 Tax=Streptomyces violaceusniger TaxID=68280 RepID=A0A4D4KW05_STRVO|nr:hypothetical protein SVIO_029870 [Streptomyces violaceusniger]